MNAYRQQQLAAAALIDSGNYTAEQVAEVYGWIKRKPPERAAPERSGTTRQQTGDKNALTPRRKCGIIKAIRRHVNRWKQKQEEKKMTIYGRAITNDDMCNISDYMIDEIREELHGKLAPCSNEKFLQEYIKRDPEILEILRNEFDFLE